MNDTFHSHQFKSMTVSTVTHVSDDVMVLRCTGRLVIGEDADALRERTKKLLVEGHRVVVNLSELEHIASQRSRTARAVSCKRRAPSGNTTIRLSPLPIQRQPAARRGRLVFSSGIGSLPRVSVGMKGTVRRPPRLNV